MSAHGHAIDIRELLPHAGLMCLLEEVIEWDDAQVLLGTRTHLRTDNPLRCAGRLDTLHLCEYGAQAMAVHGGLLARREGRRAAPGLLVSLRDVWLAGGDLAGLAGALQVRALRLHGDASGWQYAFEASHAGQLLARGRAAVVLRA
jgi:predicted hotdog family 3-hydroxylacyl-ACP dehydratase